MPNTNRTSRHAKPGDADRQSYHPGVPGNWSDPRPRTVQQALDDLAAGTAGGGSDIGARVYNSANQAIATSTWTTLAFDSERYDTDSIHSTGSYTDRLTCKTAGKYLVWFNGHFTYVSSGGRIIELRRTSGATTTTVGRHKHLYSAPGFHAMTLVDLVVNDYMTVRVYQDAGSSINITVNGNWSPEFAMQRVG